MVTNNRHQTLKKHLTNVSLLSYPLPDGPFLLNMDTSNVGIEGVLSKLKNRHGRVIRYFFKGSATL